jgi:hypothetical protein
VERFRRRGYLCFDCLRPRLWNLAEVDYWYAQNMLLFVAEHHWQARPELQSRLGPPSAHAMSLVHPRKYLRLSDDLTRTSDVRNHGLVDVLAALPGMTARSVGRRLHRLFGGGTT